MAGEGAREVQALEDRLGRTTGVPGQPGENVRIEGIGGVHVQHRAPAQDRVSGQHRSQIQNERRPRQQREQSMSPHPRGLERDAVSRVRRRVKPGQRVVRLRSVKAMGEHD